MQTQTGPATLRRMQVRQSRLSEEQTDLLLRSFVTGTAARAAAQSAKVNRHTATLFYHRLREVIARHLPAAPEIALAADLEGMRPAGDDPRLVPVLGLVETGGRVHVVTLPANAPHALAHHSVRRLDAVVYRRNNAPHAALELVLVQNADTAVIGAFWSSVQRLLRRFRGIPSRNLVLFVKECEWRLHYGTEHRLLQTLRLWLRAERLARPR